MEARTRSSAACVLLLPTLLGFHGESFFLRCCQVSVLDVLPPCVMTSLSAKRGSVFAFSLMPTCEKAILRLGPVFLASLSARLRNSNGSQHSK